MRSHLRLPSFLLFTIAFLLSACTAGQLPLPVVSGTTYYVDCTAGSNQNTGTSPQQAWSSLDPVNQHTFQPGDGIFLKRGTTCRGKLQPKGSGTEGNVITLGAYDQGSLPVVDGGGAEKVFTLVDQQYWDVGSLEFKNGSRFGILVSSSPGAGTLRHIHLANLVVHDVTGSTLDSKTTGLVIFQPESGTRFEDVLVDGVTAYKTTLWAGISILGNNEWPFDNENPKFGSNITVRNSLVHDTFGDGITLFYVKDGLIENSIAYNTGLQPSPQTIGTPSSIWTWACHDCTVQFNESYWAHSPDVDGGCYDIDWGTKNNTYQYNYGHDCDGYCLSVFGAGGLTTTNTVIRYNICANNGRRLDLASRQGDIFYSTWDGGTLDGVQVYNNTFFWNPKKSYSAVVNAAAFTGNLPNLFANNLIVSGVAWISDSVSAVQFDHNLYWYSGERPPVWIYNKDVFISFKEYQHLSKQDEHGLFADPRLDPNNQPQKDSPLVDAGMLLEDNGGRDYRGVSVPSGSAPDIGALEFSGVASVSIPAGPADPTLKLKRLDGSQVKLSSLQGGPVLLVFLDLSRVDSPSHNLSALLRSLMVQHGEEGVNVVMVIPSLAPALLENRLYDWQLADLWYVDGALAGRVMNQYNVQVNLLPTVMLIAPDGTFQQSWQGSIQPAMLDFALHPYLSMVEK